MAINKGIQMKRKELSEKLTIILQIEKPFGLQGIYNNNLVL